MIIRLQGGLGNQLFQYALYLELRARGRTVKIDEESGFVSDRQRRPCLKELSGVDYVCATDKEIKTLRDAFMDPASRIRRKLTGRKNREWEEPDGHFHPEVLTMDEVYLNGYFQSEEYFPDRTVREKLLMMFDESIKSRLLPGKDAYAAADDSDTAGAFTGRCCRNLAERITADGGNSVSLHIRRGDYLQPGTAETHGGICTEKYYEKAVSLMLERVPEAVFYVFSDDPGYAAGWVKEHNDGQGRTVTDVRPVFVAADKPDGEDARDPVNTKEETASAGGEAIDDVSSLLLMRMCRHHILANSSFSWWGAWGTDGEVLVPGRWFNNRADDGIYTDRMQRIEC